MNGKEIKEKSKKHFKKTGKYLERVIPVYDAEDLHHFRAEYKKLRAFLRILSNGKADKKIKLTKKVKKLYHVAGSLRDIQLQTARVNEQTDKGLEKPIQYLKFLNQEKQKLKLSFAELNSGNPVSHNQKISEKKLPCKFTFPDFKKFIRKKKQSLVLITKTGVYNDATLHETRKIIKDIFYNAGLFQTPGAIRLFSDTLRGNDEKYLPKLLEELGEYHDKAVSIELLKPEWLNAVNSTNRQSLHLIKEIWVDEKNRLKEPLIKKITGLNTANPDLL
jgi:CHAD domain-containing protein